MQAYGFTSVVGANPGLNILGTIALSSVGGTVQLLEAGQVLDGVSWGTDAIHEGAVAPASSADSSLVRRQSSDGNYQDTASNVADFTVTPHSCNGLTLNEIQPLRLDATGNDISQSIELLKNNAVTTQDCGLKK